MDIVSVAAPKRRRRTKQDADPANGPMAIVEDPIDTPTYINVDASEPEQPKARDIGNWQYREWKGMPMWYNTKTHRSSFDERFVRKHRHQ